MTPFNINGKTIYISDITKLLFMTDDEYNEEMKDLIAQDLGEDVDNPFGELSDAPEPEIYDDDYPELKDLINKKMS